MEKEKRQRKWKVCLQQENSYVNAFQADHVWDNEGWDIIVYLKSAILPKDQEHNKVRLYLLSMLPGEGDAVCMFITKRKTSSLPLLPAESSFRFYQQEI